MKKAVTTFFGYDYFWQNRLNDIREVGFDSYLTSADFRFENQNGEFSEQCAYCDKIGLMRDTLHSSYVTEDLHYFWEDNIKGDEILNKLIEELKLAKKYNFKALVVHILGTPSKIGLSRFRKFLNYAEEIKLPIAIENIENAEILDFVFDNFESDYLKFCFDSGHQNWSKNQKDVLDKYLDKLICLHLHDNDGINDLHTLNKYGNINWNNLAKTLAKKKDIEDVCLSYELIMRYKGKETPREVLKECYKQACELEKMILENKKQE